MVAFVASAYSGAIVIVVVAAEIIVARVTAVVVVAVVVTVVVVVVVAFTVAVVVVAVVPSQQCLRNSFEFEDQICDEKNNFESGRKTFSNQNNFFPV